MQAVRAFLLAALAEAIACLAPGRPVSDDDVHRLRKALKRARAALRLLRHALGENRFRTENVLLRDTGRAFAAVRDRASLIEALDRLGASHGGRAHQRQIGQTDPVRRILQGRRAGARRAFLRSAAADAARALKSCQRRVARWMSSRTARADIPGDLGRIYRRGRRAFALASRTRAPEALHEWRKQVKYLQNALLALCGGRHKGAYATAARFLKDAAQLAEALGEEHDLAALARELHDPAYSGAGRASLEFLLALIRRERRKRGKRMLSIGRHLFVRGPARFLSHLSMPAPGPGGKPKPSSRACARAP